jgi:hypothetical protein
MSKNLKTFLWFYGVFLVLCALGTAFPAVTVLRILTVWMQTLIPILTLTLFIWGVIEWRRGSASLSGTDKSKYGAALVGALLPFIGAIWVLAAVIWVLAAMFSSN